MLDLNSLRNELAFVDLSTLQQSSNSTSLEQLIVRKESLKIKMYQEANHSRPHFHIDYGSEKHIASYAIDTGERLIGNLDNKYDKAISEWVEQNREKLSAIWKDLQNGGTPDGYIQELTNL